MRRKFQFSCLIVAVTAVLAPAYSVADESIRFGRTPDISPDGQLVAFSYLGDLWTVPSTGGTARLITMHQEHDYRPLFSPDGRRIAFASKRHDNYDVFVVNTEGGKPTRLTYHSSNDYPCDWSPDGKFILFASTRAVEYPPRYELYKVPADGGRVQRVTYHEGRDGAFSPDGSEIAYIRGPGTWYRKGYRGSANDEIWIGNTDGSNNRQLTRFNGQDSYPIWSPDRRFVYYVSDHFGKVANIVRQEIATAARQPLAIKDPPKQITFHKEDGVRRARLSRDGKSMVYECGADLYVAATEGGSPRKLPIRAFADDKTNPKRTVNYTSAATEFAVSRDEKYIAFVVHGEIFLIPRGGGRAKRLTNSPSNDHGLAWSPDSRKLLFLSDRTGHEDVYLLQSDDPAHSRLVEAHRFKVTQLTNTPAAETGLIFSPSGKRVAFLREGRLYTMQPDGKDEKLIVAEPMVIDYEWSPDSRWICYSRLDGSYASEMYIVPATGPTAAEPARNITRYATYNAHITWSQRGQKIAFLSERGLGAERNVHVLYLQKPAVKGSRPANAIDWQDVDKRVRRLSSKPANRAAISKDGSMIAFGSTEDDELWLAKSDGSSLKRLSTGKIKPTQIQWSQLLSSLIYFRDGTGAIRMVTVTGKGEPLKLPFLAQMTIDRHDDYQQIFDQSWRTLHETFYDAKFHGVDWKAVRRKYRPVVKHVAMEEDLHALINLMVGELNASHLGIRAATSSSKTSTAHLGILLDERYHGKGLKVKEIIRRGPADRHGLAVAPGDIITKINRAAIDETVNIAQLLNNQSSSMVELEVTSNLSDPKDRRTIEIKPTSRKVAAALMYERWIESNTQKVSALSKGKLGYVHIPSMDKTGLDRFVRSLYSDNFDKEAIVLDVRYNGGGYTHDRVLNYLGGKDHTFFLQRHGTKGTVFRAGDRKWSKPLVLLINNLSFSDAEIFPSAFRTLKLGKLVGLPTGGRVIGASAIKLIDGSTFRVPRTGVFTAAGENMERRGVEPDVLVENEPDELDRNEDAQLAKAVEVLLKDVARWKQKRKNVTLQRDIPRDQPTPRVDSKLPAAPVPQPAIKK